MQEAPTKRLLIVLNEAYFFVSHRLPVALEATRMGYEVHVAAPSRHVWAAPGFDNRWFEEHGYHFHPIPLSRRGQNPISEVITIVALWFLFRRVRPDVLHLLTIKPCLYGGLAARLLRMRALVFSFTGLGQVYSARSYIAAIRRFMIALGLRAALRHRNLVVFFQNSDDHDLMRKQCVLRPGVRSIVVAGSGVDLAHFPATPVPTEAPLVLLAARLIWDKGIDTFVEAARTLKKLGTPARFVIVGDTQPSNPRAVPKKQLEAWAREGMIEWWGFRNDMPAILKQTTVVCLPTSYGEGVPKILLEAAASGRPIVASDLSGCKFAVRDGQNGILVPAKDAPSTAAALRRLLDDPDLMQIMGDKGRVLAEEEFSDHEIARQTVEAYDALAANATNRT